MGVKRIRLEGLGRDIELPSCKVKEYPLVRQLAMRYMVAVSDDSALEEVAKEVVERFAPGLSPDDLTMDDIWEILMAVAGSAQSEFLRQLPKIGAQNWVDFFQHPERREALIQYMETELSDTPGITAKQNGENM